MSKTKAQNVEGGNVPRGEFPTRPVAKVELISVDNGLER